MIVMNKKFYLVFAALTALFSVMPISVAECSVLWESVSGDFREAVLESEKEETNVEPVSADERIESAEMVEIEYDGKMISVDIRDLILMADGNGGQKVDIGDPSKYEKQLENAPLYGVRTEDSGAYQNVSQEGDEYYADGVGAGLEADPNLGITEREYEEEQRARRWAEVFE
ncbi:MAG: hypothetical protein LBO21_03845, partial [Synergistaceae bacterium]|nr:hypothetical protein [Synergistaceae bacterium]